MKFSERFWSKVDKNGPVPERCPELGNCWVWTAYKDKLGYGRIGVGSREEGQMLASRAAWLIETGSLPDNNACHKCDNPGCVRFTHLFDGTQEENLRDMSCKGRSNSEKVSGHLNVNSKLTPDQVYDAFFSSETERSCGKRLGVSHTVVGLIRRRESYLNVTREWKARP